jgi:probable F420-dependent oxidoreductase
VKIGIMYGFTHGPGDFGAASRVYGELMDQIALADGLGYDDLWLSEHHFTETSYCPSPLVMASAAAMRTSRIGIGVGVAPIPFHSPIRLAEDCAVVDNLSNGRVRLGVGIGYRAEEFRSLELSTRGRGSMLEEAVTVIRQCWAREAFTYHGRHYSFTELGCTPKPVQEQIPIWVSGGAATAIERAARIGNGWFAIGLTPEQLRHYHEAVKALQTPSVDANVAALPLPWIIVSEDPERDQAVLRPHIFAELRLFTAWLASGGMFPVEAIPASEDHADALGMVTIGTPDQVIAKIADVVSQTPLDRLVFLPNIAGAPIEIANRSLELFAQRVMPAVASLGAEVSPMAVDRATLPAG